MTFLVQTAFAIFCCLAVHAACFVPSSCSCSDTESKFGFSFAVGTAETGVGIAAGVAVGLHGCDQASAGWMKMVTGRDYDTFTSRGMQGLGVPRDAANIVDAGMSIVGSAGIGIAARAGTVAGAEGSAINRVTTDFIGNAEVTSFGKVVGRGTVDVRSTINGIEKGVISPRNIFKNEEGLLPLKSQGYYREYVLPTPGVKGVGSQRVIRGCGGEYYYTPDHYHSLFH